MKSVVNVMNSWKVFCATITILVTGLFFPSGLSCVKSNVDSDTHEDLYSQHQCVMGAIVRGDTAAKKIALVFTGDEYAEGGKHIRSVLERINVKGSFFLTGNFYRNQSFEGLIKSLMTGGHYLGAHSDQHLLYCDWVKRDSLLISHDQFLRDLSDNYAEMQKLGLSRESSPFFLPPYEWYNDTISKWTRESGLQLINYSAGTLSHADYTTPDLPHYRTSSEIYQSIVDYELKNASGLNGFILLSHVGTSPERTDKFYFLLEELLLYLKLKDYEFVRIDSLLQ